MKGDWIGGNQIGRGGEHKQWKASIHLYLCRGMQAEAKRATEATAGTTASVGKIGTGLKCIPQPAFIAERIKLFEAVYARNQEEYKSKLIP